MRSVETTLASTLIRPILKFTFFKSCNGIKKVAEAVQEKVSELNNFLLSWQRDSCTDPSNMESDIRWSCLLRGNIMSSLDEGNMLYSLNLKWLLVRKIAVGLLLTSQKYYNFLTMNLKIVNNISIVQWKHMDITAPCILYYVYYIFRLYHISTDPLFICLYNSWQEKY